MRGNEFATINESGLVVIWPWVYPEPKEIQVKGYMGDSKVVPHVCIGIFVIML
jgi:hypothetical protein